MTMTPKGKDGRTYGFVKSRSGNTWHLASVDAFPVKSVCGELTNPLTNSDWRDPKSLCHVCHETSGVVLDPPITGQ